MDYACSILKDIGLDVEVGKSFTGGGDKYISAVQRYFKSYENNKTKVEEFYSSADWENYCITVHALKSNSKMIGATKLGAAFEMLEEASRNQDIESVNKNHEAVMQQYAELVEKLKPIGEMTAVKPADEISGEEAKKVADDLLEALDDFDDELSSELVRKLSGYPFRPTQRERLREASDFVRNFLYDEAAEIIKEIMPAVEE